MEYKFTFPEIVKARGLNASAVARLIGVSRPAAYSLMRPGTAQIKIETINKICQGFDLTPADLFAGESNDDLSEKLMEQYLQQVAGAYGEETGKK